MAQMISIGTTAMGGRDAGTSHARASGTFHARASGRARCASVMQGTRESHAKRGAHAICWSPVHFHRCCVSYEVWLPNLHEKIAPQLQQYLTNQ